MWDSIIKRKCLGRETWNSKLLAEALFTKENHAAILNA